MIARFPSADREYRDHIRSGGDRVREGTHRPAPGLGRSDRRRKPGVSIVLKRNPAYWKQTRCRMLDSIRIDIEQNRDLELLRFRRGEIQLIDKLTPDLYERLASDAPGTAVDAGPTLDSEFLWFNQARRAPIPRGNERMVPIERPSGARFPRRSSGRICAAWFIAVMPARRPVRSRRPTSCGSRKDRRPSYSIRRRPRNCWRADGFRLQDGVLARPPRQRRRVFDRSPTPAARHASGWRR